MRSALEKQRSKVVPVAFTLETSELRFPLVFVDSSTVAWHEPLLELSTKRVNSQLLTNPANAA